MKQHQFQIKNVLFTMLTIALHAGEWMQLLKQRALW
jgi:hypothetical protein